jgi:hypothetical protein
MTFLNAHDRYSGSPRRVSVDQDAAHVVLTVQAVDGDGEAMLTPAQARAVAAWLTSEAAIAEIVEGDDQPLAGRWCAWCPSTAPAHLSWRDGEQRWERCARLGRCAIGMPGSGVA